jgi:Fungal protein kinase
MIADDDVNERIRGGILIDWDLSEFNISEGADGLPREPRRRMRTVSWFYTTQYSRLLKYLSQGTWQFMAGDLVKAPTQTRQTVTHDLESFFWVLMWVVTKTVKTNWMIGEHSSFLKHTMSPEVFGSNGSENAAATGGRSKIDFLSGSAVDDLSIEGNSALQELIVSWRDAVVARYTNVVSTTVEKKTKAEPRIFELTITQKVQKTVQKEEKFRYHSSKRDYHEFHPFVILGTPPFTLSRITDRHDCMLLQITCILEERDWPKDDEACYLPTSRSAHELRISVKRSASVLQLGQNSRASKKLRSGATPS